MKNKILKLVPNWLWHLFGLHYNNGGIDYHGTNTGSPIKNRCEDCDLAPSFTYVETRFGEICNTKTGARYIDNTIKFFCKEHYPFKSYINE